MRYPHLSRSLHTNKEQNCSKIKQQVQNTQQHYALHSTGSASDDLNFHCIYISYGEALYLFAFLPPLFLVVLGFSYLSHSWFSFYLQSRPVFRRRITEHVWETTFKKTTLQNPQWSQALSLWTKPRKSNFGMNYRIPEYIGVDSVHHNSNYLYSNAL